MAPLKQRNRAVRPETLPPSPRPRGYVVLTGLARVRAWLLLALFLGAGTSLPSADALLHHLHPDPFAGRVHVEPTGGCAAHSDHCTLGTCTSAVRRTIPGGRTGPPASR